MNLLFVTYPATSIEPFVVAYDLDYPEPGVRQWRVDATRGVEYSCRVPRNNGGENTGKHGMWDYLAKGVWRQLTEKEAYAMFPTLRDAIETWVEPW